jgi:putative endonuclease
MWFSRKQGSRVPPAGAGDDARPLPGQVTTKSRGDAAESAARAYLGRAGLKFVEANYRTPGRGGGEIDLVMRAPDGTLVFVEVRQRADASHGGAAASIRHRQAAAHRAGGAPLFDAFREPAALPL